MNNIIKTLLLNTISEVIVNGNCFDIDGTRYFLDEGVLYSFKYYQSKPKWIERFDYGNSEAAILMFVHFLSNMIDVENIEIVEAPKPSQNITWS